MANSQVETLRARLAAAEKVCVLLGWTTARNDTDQDKALHELWVEWMDLSGVSADPADHPELSDEHIARLARRRDETRARTLERRFSAAVTDYVAGQAEET